MKKIFERYADIIVLISLFIPIFIVFFDVFFFKKVLYGGDNFSINVPAKILFAEFVKKWTLPLWNPYSFSGIPFMADINLGLFSPFTLFYFWLSPFDALTVNIISAVYLSGVGMYIYMKNRDVDFISSFFSAVIYMLSGTIMTHTLNTAILNTIVFFPFILLAIDKLEKSNSIVWTIILSVFLSFSLLGGHIQYFYYLSIFSFFYILTIHVSFRKKIQYILFSYIPVIFLTLFQTIPFLESALSSTRPVSDLIYAGSVSLPGMIKLILPNFFGIFKDGTSWGSTADINGYIGLIPLFLSIYVALTERKGKIIFYAFSSIISLLLSFGMYSPLYLLFYYLAPFFSRFRSPGGILIIYTFSLSVLAGYALYSIRKKLTIRSKGLILLCITCFVIFVTSFIVYITSPYIIKDFFTFINTTVKSIFLTHFLSYTPLRMNIIFFIWIENILLSSCILFIFFLILIFYKKSVLSLRFIIFFIVILTISELLFTARNPVLTIDKAYLSFHPQLKTFFASHPGQYRILSLSDPGAKPPFGDSSYFTTEAIKAFDLLQPNINLLLKQRAITGYASMVPSLYANYMNDPKKDPTQIETPDPHIPQITELGVKYIITGGRYKKELDRMANIKLIFSFFDGRINRNFYIYQHLDSKPLISVKKEEDKIYSIIPSVFFDENSVRIKIINSKIQDLVYREINYPGWKAKINDEEVMLKTDDLFKTLKIPKGTHFVTFFYAPHILLASLFISMMNWIYIFIFLIFVIIKKQKKIRHKFHIRKSNVKKYS